MRRSRRTQGSDDGDVDMTPMLDIVFIMLIFFIVTATFLDERGVDLTQPPPPPDNENTPPSSNPAIVVYVDSRNSCAVDGKSTGCSDVILDVETLLSQKPKAAVILRMDERATHRYLVQLKDEFEQAQLKTKIEIIRNTSDG